MVLDVKDPLIQLANTINWTVFDDAFEQHYSQNNGRQKTRFRYFMTNFVFERRLDNFVPTDNTPERLKVRHEVTKSRLAQYSRDVV